MARARPHPFTGQARWSYLVHRRAACARRGNIEERRCHAIGEIGTARNSNSLVSHEERGALTVVMTSRAIAPLPRSALFVPSGSVERGKVAGLDGKGGTRAHWAVLVGTTALALRWPGRASRAVVTRIAWTGTRGLIESGTEHLDLTGDTTLSRRAEPQVDSVRAYTRHLGRSCGR